MIKNLVPIKIKRKIRLYQLKNRFKESTINTDKVSSDVKLGKCVLYEGSDIRNGVEIGDYSFVNVDTIIQAAKIGKFCSIGARCQIGMPEHPTDHLSTSPYIYSKNRSVLNISTWIENQNPPVIGNDVWIGANAVILQGVKIGDGAIIAAGAVVTKDVEPYSIVGGVPAKLIRKRFDENTIEKLLKLKWWDMSTEQMKNYKDLFLAESNFVNKI